MRVLLVEDDVALSTAIAGGLDDENIDVDVVHDGLDGLWLATEGSYDAIVLDIMVPRCNGYEICRRLREVDVATPVLMLTAKSGEFDEAEALETGADDYLRKPFSFVVLIARLRALARRRARTTTSSLRFGPLELDPTTATATRGGTTIPLTRRELAVLEMLVRAGGEPLPTEQIRRHVWGTNSDAVSNVVPVTIGYLRRKIDQGFDHPLIETLRGIGYRLTAPSPDEQP